MGLSVLETARKLKATRNDALYDQFVQEFLPDGARTHDHGRGGKIRFYLDCDLLGHKQHFEQLLAKLEHVRITLL